MLIIRGKKGHRGLFRVETGLRKRPGTGRTSVPRILCSEINKNENSCPEVIVQYQWALGQLWPQITMKCNLPAVLLGHQHSAGMVP